MPRVPASFAEPKFIIAMTIVLAFIAAYFNHPNATMDGALIGAFAGAWGYYLGSSSATSQLRNTVDLALGLAADANNTPDIPVTNAGTAPRPGAPT